MIWDATDNTLADINVPSSTRCHSNELSTNSTSISMDECYALSSKQYKSVSSGSVPTTLDSGSTYVVCSRIVKDLEIIRRKIYQH
jgi:hypothetical protein